MPPTPHDHGEKNPAPASSPARAKVGFARPTRDAVTTIREDGSHRYLHPADAPGRFFKARTLSGWLLIVVYLSLPWIKIGAHPAVFLDVAARRFHLFGLTFAFQDIWMLFFGITGLGFGLFFITSLLGRVWCGWACPQTVFLDHIYRRIERLLEGDAPKRRALDAAPWTTAKILRRSAKHILYVAVSAIIAHLFLAYFISIPALWSMMSAAPAEHWGAFVFVALFTGALYGNFAWFREQLCLIICPYGRLQSVLIDDHSLVIGYDEKRGEPRGKLSIPNAGACIDCNRCVRVCPTGIDIRQGLQMECIGCAACVDACDEVMTKINRPTGLIRYDSLSGLRGEKTKWLRPRVFIYGALLLVGAIVATLALSTVRPANLQITRLGGTPYFVDATSVRNQFLVRIVNKRDHAQRFALTISDPSVEISGWSDAVELAPGVEEVRPLILQIPLGRYTGPAHLQVQVTSLDESFSLKRTIDFVGPNPAYMKKSSAPDGSAGVPPAPSSSTATP
ncbi:cytochrome c oxidase accessory protein CcoG [Nibricoccus aquaticus]|uniref:Cytochrome c oxidase accessory protein CcoG n=1 Tax=Nibricoccus aquaticus TaxID=2576891 RepID=A0A290QK69_9BACT|nr:cytochrome c oxidase accessory protein CcoG [Nibricoccus aquaticus]ATC65738.1 cytochrome c oxidase accessory protein CcoG [Nibricoccus aquaticus]